MRRLAEWKYNARPQSPRYTAPFDIVPEKALKEKRPTPGEPGHWSIHIKIYQSSRHAIQSEDAASETAAA